MSDEKLKYDSKCLPKELQLKSNEFGSSLRVVALRASEGAYVMIWSTLDHIHFGSGPLWTRSFLTRSILDPIHFGPDPL